MADVSAEFRRNFGVLKAQQLVRLGIRRSQIAAGVKRGALVRLRPGWYGFRDLAPAPNVVRAVTAGGVLSGASALALHGAWNVGGAIDVRAARVDRVLARDGIRAFALPTRESVPCASAVDPPGVALRVALHTRTPLEIAMLVDSLARRRLLDPAEIRGLAADRPADVRRAVDRMDPTSDSGIETCVRIWLESHRISFRTQVVIDGVGRVDFLVGERLIIEVDGKEHHTGVEAFARDRRRDLELHARGYLVVRVTYSDVMHQWDWASNRILAITRRREHLRPPRDPLGLVPLHADFPHITYQVVDRR